MENPNTCIRCGKPCAASAVMCSACEQWLQEQTSRETQNMDIPAKGGLPAGADRKTCVKCGAPMPLKSRFCPKCGQSQDAAPAQPVEPPAQQPANPNRKTCVKCGAPMPLKSRFCPKCGQSQDAAPVPAAPKPAAAEPQPEAPQKTKAHAAPTQPVESPAQQPVNPNRKACVKCGASMPLKSRFCPRCGQDQTEMTETPDAKMAAQITVPLPVIAQEEFETDWSAPERGEPASPGPERLSAPVHSEQGLAGTGPKACVKCGAAIPAKGQFCPKCGQDQNAVTAAAAGYTIAQEQEKTGNRKPNAGGKAPRKKKKSGIKVFLAIVGVLVLVAVVAVGLMLALGGRIQDLNPMAGDKPASETTLNEDGENDSFTAAEDPEAPEEPEETAEPEDEEASAVSTATVACIGCGAEIPENAQFCPYCGQNQSEPVEPEEPEETEEPEEEEPVEITAALCDPQPGANQLLVTSTSQSSVVTQSGNHNNTAAMVIDGNLETSWQEGVNGNGIGEWIRLDFGGDRMVRYLRLYLGNWRDADWYAQNNVPKVLEITMGDETFTVEFPYDREEHWVAFSSPVKCSSITLTIKDVYEGNEYDDTCIADVMVYGTSDE